MTNNNHSTIINFIWQVADDILRDIYVKGKYRDVILPMTVITRIDSELTETKERVLKKYEEYKNKITNIEPVLQKETGYQFYNISPFTLETLLKDPKNITSNFRQYLNGFSSNIQDILQKFKFYNQIETLEENDILFALIQKFISQGASISPKKTFPAVAHEQQKRDKNNQHVLKTQIRKHHYARTVYNPHQRNGSENH